MKRVGYARVISSRSRSGNGTEAFSCLKEFSMSDINEMRRHLLIGSAALAASFAIPPVAALAAEPVGEKHMSSNTITTKDGTQIYYKDWGSGQPIVFHHGWPLSS